ncbi:AAA family ATPase [Myxococcota bacterium]|jgi:SpoVK/Ycf46/Vps4 family AAA+-type ATPase|nr:AAA family ATPase [Myxococcota bacterium]
MKTGVSSTQEITDLIKAAYPLIYIVSPEEERVEGRLREIGRDRGRKIVTWSCTEGFREEGNVLSKDVKDPARALDGIEGYEDHAIFVMRDFHPYLTDPTIVRRLRDLCRSFASSSRYKKHIVLLSAVFKAPLELEKDMAVVDFDLPTAQEIEQVLDRTLASVPLQARPGITMLKDPGQKKRVVDAALGLTESEISYVLSKALVRKKDFDIATILAEKKHIIRKSGILEFYETDAQWSDVGGLEVLKDWLKKRQKAFSQEAQDFGLPLPKGILLIGVPGCGKSLTAKAVSGLWQMPLLRLDVGKVFSSLVGSSEENIRRAIRTAEAVAPSILWLDEIEKGFSGTKSSGESDAGTTARVFASFITWLQEKTSPVFVIATANDVSMLPPELLRKGRFDEIFFVDLPNPAERAEIFRIQIEKLNRRSRVTRDPGAFDVAEVAARTQAFSGAEIEQAVISALYDAFDRAEDLSTAGILASVSEMVPLSLTMKEKIDGMRDWANGRARRASLAGDEAAEEAAPRIEM